MNISSLKLNLIYEAILNRSESLWFKESDPGMQRLPHPAITTRDKGSKTPTCTLPSQSAPPPHRNLILILLFIETSEIDVDKNKRES